MISFLRKQASSTVVTILLGLLIASFAIWGIGDVFRAGGNDSLAMVGKTKISPNAFAREYENEVNRWRQQFGEAFNPSQAKALGLPRQVLQRMVNREVFDETGRELGLRASDAQVRDYIRANPAFRNSLGEFDRGLYANILRYARMTEAQFEAAARADITREQLLNSMARSITVPEALTNRLYTYHGETRTIDIARVTASAMTVAAPDQVALKGYYDKHNDAFMAPEYRSLSYLYVTATDFDDDVTVGEEDIIKYYDDHSAEYSTPESRSLDQMVFQDQAAAQAAVDAIRGGADFAAIAKEKLGLGADELSLGTRTEEQISGELGKDAAAAIFSTPQGEVAGPIQSPFGWHVVRIAAITPEVRRPIDEVRAEITAKTRHEKAIDQLYEMTNKIEDMIAGGSTLEEVAKEIGVPLLTISGTDQNGRGPDGAPAQSLPTAENFLQDAFSTEVGTEPILHEASNEAYYLLRVDSVTPPALRPYETVEAAVAAAWTKEAKEAKAKETADSLMAALNDGKPLAEAAPAAIPVQTGLTARRLPGNDAMTLAPEIRNAAFTATVGGNEVVKAADGDGYVLVHVSSATPGNAAENAAEAEEFARGLTSQYGNDVLVAYQVYLTRIMGVSFNEKLFESTISQLTE